MKPNWKCIEHKIVNQKLKVVEIKFQVRQFEIWTCLRIRAIEERKMGDKFLSPTVEGMSVIYHVRDNWCVYPGVRVRRPAHVPVSRRSTWKYSKQGAYFFIKTHFSNVIKFKHMSISTYDCVFSMRSVAYKYLEYMMHWGWKIFQPLRT